MLLFNPADLWKVYAADVVGEHLGIGAMFALGGIVGSIFQQLLKCRRAKCLKRPIQVSNRKPSTQQTPSLTVTKSKSRSVRHRKISPVKTKQRQTKLEGPTRHHAPPLLDVGVVLTAAWVFYVVVFHFLVCDWMQIVEPCAAPAGYT